MKSLDENRNAEDLCDTDAASILFRGNSLRHQKQWKISQSPLFF